MKYEYTIGSCIGINRNRNFNCILSAHPRILVPLFICSYFILIWHITFTFLNFYINYGNIYSYYFSHFDHSYYKVAHTKRRMFQAFRIYDFVFMTFYAKRSIFEPDNHHCFDLSVLFRSYTRTISRKEYKYEI